MDEANPVFVSESDMTVPVARWMRSAGMAVRSEFVTPWGMCDLVGISLNREKVARRLDQKQTRAIGSITRSALLLQIPDVEEGEWTTLTRLVRRFGPSVPAGVVSEQIERLIAERFVISSSRGRLQKLNGWIPLQDRLVAVELKLCRIEEAMHQALSNLGFAEESYVAFPSDVARRVDANAARWSRSFNAGVGLLSVTKRGCKVLVPAHKARHPGDNAIQFYCVEKFWRTHVRGS